MGDMEREPIFWTSTVPGYNHRDRVRETKGPDGEIVIERIPQRGHQGDYENRQPAKGVRSVRMVDHYGNSKDVALTNAAAHLDWMTPYGQNQLALARFHGWFMLGECPCALLTTGTIKAEDICDKRLLQTPGGMLTEHNTPCRPNTFSTDDPCPHALDEKRARMDRNARKEAAKEAQYKSDAVKAMEQSQIAHNELMAKLTEAIMLNNNADMIRELIAEFRAAQESKKK